MRFAETGLCLFPAYAGVILAYNIEQAKKETFPRIRGGDPVLRLM